MTGKIIKAISLVKLLTRKEAITFGKIISAHKRKSLSKLFTFVHHHAISEHLCMETKAAMFKATFAKEYSKKKDYLLRNELRLLAIELVNYMSIEEIKSMVTGDTLVEKGYYLQYLWHKKAYGLFEVEFPVVLKEAVKQMDFETAAKITRLHIEHFVSEKQTTAGNYKDLLKMVDEYSRLIGSAFLHQNIYIQHKRAFTERTMKALLAGYSITPLQSVVAFDLNDKTWLDEYLNYMRLLTESYCLSGKDKIATLEKARKHISRITKKGFDKDAAKATTAAGIALEYFLTGNYGQSLRYHIIALKNSGTLPGESLIAVVFNYLSTLIRLEDYSEAGRIIEKYRAIWENMPRMKDRFLCLKAMCHLFLKQHDAAWECVPIDRKQSGIDHYYYYRFIQIISLYQRGELQLSMNEAENFEHTVRYQDKDENYLRLIVLMKKFLRVQSEKQVLLNQEFLSRKIKLKNEMSLQRIEQELPDKALFYKWILAQLGYSPNDMS